MPYRAIVEPEVKEISVILFLPYITMLIFCSSRIFALILTFQNIAQKYDYLDSWGFLCAKVLQLWLTLCDPMDCNPPGSSIHGILQARILGWVSMSSSGDLPHPGIEPVPLTSPALAGGFFTTSTTQEAQTSVYSSLNTS